MKYCFPCSFLICFPRRNIIIHNSSIKLRNVLNCLIELSLQPAEKKHSFDKANHYMMKSNRRDVEAKYVIPANGITQPSMGLCLDAWMWSLLKNYDKFDNIDN